MPNLQIHEPQIPEQLIQAVRSGNLVIVLGAGISKLTAGLPTWDEFVDVLTKELQIDGRLELNHKLDKTEVAQLYRQGSPEALKEKVLSCFRITDLNSVNLDVYKSILSLSPRAIISTNYDNGLEIALSRLKRKAYICSQGSSLPYWDQKSLLVLKAHGSISDGDDIVLTREDYARYVHIRRVMHQAICQLFYLNHVLYLGFSLTDRNFIDLHHFLPWFITNQTKSYFDARRSFVVTTSTSIGRRQLLNYLNTDMITLQRHDDISRYLNRLKRASIRKSVGSPSKGVLLSFDGVVDTAYVRLPRQVESEGLEAKLSFKLIGYSYGGTLLSFGDSRLNPIISIRKMSKHHPSAPGRVAVVRFNENPHREILAGPVLNDEKWHQLSIAIKDGKLIIGFDKWSGRVELTSRETSLISSVSIGAIGRDDHPSAGFAMCGYCSSCSINQSRIPIVSYQAGNASPRKLKKSAFYGLTLYGVKFCTISERLPAMFD